MEPNSDVEVLAPTLKGDVLEGTFCNPLSWREFHNVLGFVVVVAVVVAVVFVVVVVVVVVVVSL